jgi:hypothetical protein
MGPLREPEESDLARGGLQQFVFVTAMTELIGDFQD